MRWRWTTDGTKPLDNEDVKNEFNKKAFRHFLLGVLYGGLGIFCGYKAFDHAFQCGQYDMGEKVTDMVIDGEKKVAEKSTP